MLKEKNRHVYKPLYNIQEVVYTEVQKEVYNINTFGHQPRSDPSEGR